MARRNKYWAIRKGMNIYYAEGFELPTEQLFSAFPEARENPMILATLTPRPFNLDPVARFSVDRELIELGTSKKAFKENKANLERVLHDERERKRNAASASIVVKATQKLGHCRARKIAALGAMKDIIETGHVMWIEHYYKTGSLPYLLEAVVSEDFWSDVLAKLEKSTPDQVYADLVNDYLKTSNSIEHTRLHDLRSHVRSIVAGCIADLNALMKQEKDRLAAIDTEERIKQEAFLPIG